MNPKLILRISYLIFIGLKILSSYSNDVNTEPRNVEVYYLLSICLVIMATIGLVHPHVFEVFDVQLTQTVLYALTGISLVMFVEFFKKDLPIFTKALAAFYGLLGLAGFIVGNHFASIPLSWHIANNFLHLFISGTLFYLSGSEEISVISESSS